MRHGAQSLLQTANGLNVCSTLASQVATAGHVRVEMLAACFADLFAHTTSSLGWHDLPAAHSVQYMRTELPSDLLWSHRCPVEHVKHAEHALLCPSTLYFTPQLFMGHSVFYASKTLVHYSNSAKATRKPCTTTALCFGIYRESCQNRVLPFIRSLIKLVSWYL